MKRLVLRVLAGGLTLASLSPVPAAFAQSDPLCGEVAKAAQKVVSDTGVSSASVAVVRGGKIACTLAVGDAKRDPKTPATPAMRYSIGSVSKQFTAAAVLMLAEEGKLSLDDPVSKYLPDLTDADKVQVR